MTRKPQSTPANESAHVALLRGINVGGKNLLPMAALSTLFSEGGCSGIRTHIQSGNVVFQATPKVALALPDRLSWRIRERFGFNVPIVLRTREELAAVASANPFLGKPGVDPDHLHVMFLADPPTAARVATLDPARSPPDSFAVVGREIFLRCPNGVARTKLTNAYFDSRLATVSTGRNWRTVLKLVELVREADGK